MDSPEQALDSLTDLEGVAQEAPREPRASLEDEVPDGGSPEVCKDAGEAPLQTTIELSFSARLVNAGPRRPKGLGKLVLNSPVILMKWEQPSLGALVLGSDTSQSIIDCWNPFNQRDTYIGHMRKLYPISYRILIVALSEEYSVPFPGYFNETIELVCYDLLSLLSFAFEREFLCHHFVLTPPFL